VFKPIELLEREFEIRISKNTFSNDPITLFKLYYSLVIIKAIVLYINKYYRLLEDLDKSRARLKT
jgi:hypothetical protein